MPARPARQRLLSGSCSSARSFAPRFLPTLGRPHAVALHFVRCDQLTAGLAPAGVRPCRAHKKKATRRRLLKVRGEPITCLQQSQQRQRQPKQQRQQVPKQPMQWPRVRVQQPVRVRQQEQLLPSCRKRSRKRQQSGRRSGLTCSLVSSVRDVDQQLPVTGSNTYGLKPMYQETRPGKLEPFRG